MVDNVLSAEIRTSIRVMELAAEMGLSNVIIETDSSEVRRLVVEKGRDRSIYATQIQELKHKLRLVDSVNFVWARRTANKVADRLAREGFLDTVIVLHMNLLK
uniref:RNase H type-1 domain-containing protein n=1 Tax=Leersia perrieri TaxID=77586 RepID=A0A0D9X1Y5_9ORYZ